MKKRGIATVTLVIELAVFILAAYIIVSIANTAASSKAVQRTILAKELANTESSLISFAEKPGKLIFRYPKNLSEHIIYFNNQKVLVYESEQTLAVQRQASFFTPNSKFQIEKKLQNPENLYFQKIGNEIKADFEIPEQEETFKFFPIDTKDQDWHDKKIVITSEQIQAMLDFDRAIAININIKSKEPAKIQEIRRIAIPDLLIITSISTKTPDSITIFISSDPSYLSQNRKLASLILNKIKEKQPDIELSLISTDSEYLLKKSNIAILVEIGNEAFKNTGSDIINSISKSVVEYYED